MKVSAVGGALLERKCERTKRVGADIESMFWMANGATKKKLLRAMGPLISMASAG
jgi:hypothetical protein